LAATANEASSMVWVANDSTVSESRESLLIGVCHFLSFWMAVRQSHRPPQT
jgi:hypothetical protein